MYKKDILIKTGIYLVTIITLYGYSMVEKSGYLMANTGEEQNYNSMNDTTENIVKSDKSDLLDTDRESKIDENLRLEQNLDTKKIAITFDDGPNDTYTERLLDELKKRNIKATFFVVGINAAQNKELILRMKNEGHLIGNHTYSHINLGSVANTKAIDEITRTNEIIKEITGEDTEYIRPPFGSYDKNYFKEKDMIVVMWDIDPRDWTIYDADKVAKDVISKAKDSQIILMHDIFETSVDAAIKIIDELTSQGYEFVTVEELLMD